MAWGVASDLTCCTGQSLGVGPEQTLAFALFFPEQQTVSRVCSVDGMSKNMSLVSGA